MCEKDSESQWKLGEDWIGSKTNHAKVRQQTYGCCNFQICCLRAATDCNRKIPLIIVFEDWELCNSVVNTSGKESDSVIEDIEEPNCTEVTKWNFAVREILWSHWAVGDLASRILVFRTAQRCLGAVESPHVPNRSLGFPEIYVVYFAGIYVTRIVRFSQNKTK